MPDFTDVTGSLAALLTTLSFLPQVFKTWRTGSAGDFSWIWIAGFGTGLALWLIYGLALGSLPLVGANGVTLSLVLMIALVKWREGGPA
ncbi:MAG: SemiSWEET transporter [Alphaproteobacteria bacterium]|nr:SemiSWEET transporter [Alphaproteobacteria bacterium]